MEATLVGQVQVPLVEERSRRRRANRRLWVVLASLTIALAIEGARRGALLDSASFPLLVLLNVPLMRGLLLSARRPDPTLTLAGDHLTIEHPAYERRIDVPLQAVHSIRLKPFQRINLRRPRRLATLDTRKLPWGWYVQDLYLPRRGHGPNLLVVLSPPRVLPPPVARGRMLGIALPRYPARALILQVADLAFARERLSEWAGHKLVDQLPDDVLRYILQGHPMVRSG